MKSWFPHHHKGLVAAVVVSGYGFGSCIWAPVETYYVNPNDLQPVQTDNTSNLYFKDGKNNVDPNWSEFHQPISLTIQLFLSFSTFI